MTTLNVQRYTPVLITPEIMPTEIANQLSVHMREFDDGSFVRWKNYADLHNQHQYTLQQLERIQLDLQLKTDSVNWWVKEYKKLQEKRKPLYLKLKDKLRDLLT